MANTIKRMDLTKQDSVPVIHTKEPFKRIRSFANVTTLMLTNANVNNNPSLVELEWMSVSTTTDFTDILTTTAVLISSTCGAKW